MIKCPCCQQPWHDVERIRLLDGVVLTTRGAVALTQQEDELMTRGMMRKPIEASDLAERFGVTEHAVRERIRTLNQKIRAKGWHFARLGVGPEQVIKSGGLGIWGLCEVIRHPDGSFVKTQEMKGPPALKPQWHHA